MGEGVYIPMESNGIQAFKLGNNFIPEFEYGISSPAFSVISISDITSESSTNNTASDNPKIINDKVNQFFHGFFIMGFITAILIILTRS